MAKLMSHDSSEVLVFKKHFLLLSVMKMVALRNVREIYTYYRHVYHDNVCISEIIERRCTEERAKCQSPTGNEAVSAIRP